MRNKTMRPKARRLLQFAPLAILGMVLFISIGGAIVMQLWNWLLPQIFGLREITFWQALGILLLSRILFGGFGFHGSGRSRFRGRMSERCANMSTEERERFREGVREKWGFDTSAGESNWR